MIVDNINNLNDNNIFLFKEEILHFISELKDNDFPGPKREIDGTQLFALFYKGNAGLPLKMESHRKYLDMHYVYNGKDIIAVEHIDQCKQITQEYNPEKDVMFFGDQPESRIVLQEKEFDVFYPEDVHSPLIGTDECWKVVIKILMA